MSISPTPKALKLGGDKHPNSEAPGGWRLGRDLGRGARGGVAASKFPPICLMTSLAPLSSVMFWTEGGAPEPPVPSISPSEKPVFREMLSYGGTGH